LPLALRLRRETGPDHTAIEQRLGLPDSVDSLSLYASWLAATRGLLGLLAPRLAEFGEWPSLGIEPLGAASLDRLDRDLRHLGHSPRPAPADLLPLPSFPHALGALYVAEGSALGNRVILRAIRGRLPVKGATAFLEGQGAATGARWTALRAALDLWGERHPASAPEVVAGARATFQAYARWLAPALGRAT
jgi:heme oxygenase